MGDFDASLDNAVLNLIWLGFNLGEFFLGVRFEMVVELRFAQYLETGGS